MVRRSAAALVACSLFTIALAPSCGSRTPLPGDDALGGGGSGGDAGTTRTCAPNCSVGHACCIGSCSGPAAVTENDCCECLPGEVSSVICPGNTCGN